MAYRSGRRKRSTEDEGRSHLDALKMTLYEFSDFKRQLLLRNGLRRGLIVRGTNLVIMFVEMSPSWLFGGRTFDFSNLPPEN